MVVYYLGELNVQQNRKNIQNVMTFYLFAVKIKSLLIDKCIVYVTPKSKYEKNKDFKKLIRTPI